MKLRLLLLFVFCTADVTRNQAVAREKEAYAVWKGKNCIQLTENVTAVAPLVDGQPDYKNVRVTGVVLDNKCFSYEVR